MNLTKEELIVSLQSLGLTVYESKVYAALLLFGPLSSSDLANKSEVPQPRVYDVIKSLMEKGLVAIIQNRPKKFIALNPEVALKDYIDKRYTLESNIYTKIINNIKNKTHFEEGLWVTSTTAAIFSMIKEAINDANYELLIASTNEVLLQIIDLLNQKNLSICLISYDEDVILNNINVDELRIRPTKGPLFFIPDFKYALTIVRLGTLSPIAYKITDEHLKNLFIEYFLGYARANSRLVKAQFDKKSSAIYVHLVRAVDHIRSLQGLGYDVEVIIDGINKKKGTHLIVEGKPISYYEDPIRGITSLEIMTKEGNRLSIGGFGAYIEDIEARKITIKVS
jgi:sugar-specific transcriptional regulator TrmB